MRIRCTACSALLQVADQVAGKRIRCPRCKEPTLAAPLPPEKPRPQSAAVRATPPPKSRKVAVDEEADDAPRPKKKKNKKRKKDKSQMIVGLAVTGGVAACIAISIAVVAFTNRSAPIPAKDAQAKTAEQTETFVPQKKRPLNQPPKANAAPKPPDETPAPVKAKPKSEPKSEPKAKLNLKPAPVTTGIGKAVNVPFDASEVGSRAMNRDNDKRFEIPIVESNFKLPDISEAEWFETGEVELKAMRRTLGESYDKIGHKDPKWDEPAHKALELAAQMYVKKRKDWPLHKDIYPQVVKAIDAGCDDPQILYLHARTLLEKATPEEVVARYLKAADAMRRSKCSPYRRTNALMYAANMLLGKSDAFDVEKAARYYSDSLDAFAQSVKEEQKDPALRPRFAELMQELQFVGAKFRSSSLAGYQLVDLALKKTPNSEVFRQKLLGHFMLSYAWEARGSGVAAIVGEDQFKLFNERLLISLNALTKAWELDPTDASTAASAITVLKGLGADAGTIKIWFDRAMSADPGSLAACNALIDFLDPKWGGNVPDLIAFGRECGKSKLVRTGIPLLLGEAHFRIATPMGTEKAAAYIRREWLWKEISDPFEAYLKAVPWDSKAHGLYAMYSAFAGRVDLARKHFEHSPTDPPSAVFNAEQFRWAREVSAVKKK
jgi:hypothetical protein